MRSTFFHFFIGFSAAVLVNLIATSVFAAENYQLLAPLTPEFGNTVNAGDFAGYAQKTVAFIISFSAALAVLMITFGGFEYMLGESMHTKEEGMHHVQSAIIGLLLLLFSALILYVINPQLLNLDLNPAPVQQTQAVPEGTPSMTNTSSSVTSLSNGDIQVNFPALNTCPPTFTFTTGSLFTNPRVLPASGRSGITCLYPHR